MKKVILGKTSLEVSRLCFGTLTVGPLQNNYDTNYAAEILAYAIVNGINFFDTAQLYQTYPHIKQAIKRSGNREVVIATKTYAYTEKQAREAFEQARFELDRDYIDIFLLHEQESIHTLNGHKEALDYLLKQKAKGYIKAVGLSTHHIAGVEAAIQAGLDLVHPIYNKQSLGIVDGDIEQMSIMVQRAHSAGIGVYSMKALGGGNLFSQAEECLNYVLSKDFIDSIAVGCSSIEEVEANINFFNTGLFTVAQKNNINNKTRKIIIEDHCTACGNCVESCGQSAITITKKAFIDKNKCVLCGYCSAKCKDFCIKII